MRKSFRSVFCFAFVIAIAVLPATAQWADSPEHSLTTSDDLSCLGLSITGEDGDREISDSTGLVQDMELRNYYALVSCDILPWLSINLGGGQSELRLNVANEHSDGDTLFTTGVRANLWDYEVKDPSFFVSRLQMHLNLSYWDSEADMPNNGGTIEWNEKRAELIFSAERFVIHPGTDHTVYPYSLLLFAGPVYSNLDIDASKSLSGNNGNTLTSSIDEEEELGLIAGGDLFISFNLSLGYEARIFSSALHKVTLAYHF